MEIHLTTTDVICRMGSHSVTFHGPPDTSEHTLPLPQPDRLVLDLPTI